MNRSSSAEPPESPLRQTPERLEWRRPTLRKIDALDARMVSKNRARHDALHLS